jgi:hypothetical protein
MGERLVKETTTWGANMRATGKVYCDADEIADLWLSIEALIERLEAAETELAQIRSRPNISGPSGLVGDPQ